MPDSPYAGLNPFSAEDAPFFFGRDHERDLIVAQKRDPRAQVGFLVVRHCLVQLGSQFP